MEDFMQELKELVKKHNVKETVGFNNDMISQSILILIGELMESYNNGDTSLEVTFDFSNFINDEDFGQNFIRTVL